MTPEQIDDYREKIEQQIDYGWPDIMFRDTDKLGRKFTTGDVRRIIDEDKPDILAIDGILLIQPVAKYRDTRERVMRVMDELKEIVTTTQVPMRLAHQVNRESEKRVSKKKNKQEDSPLDAVPTLDELAESGATEQFANRVIALRYVEGRIYMTVRKNRSGPMGDSLSARVDVDTGMISDERYELIDQDEDSEPEQGSLIDDEKTSVF
jgi:replicative DNA helicase